MPALSSFSTKDKVAQYWIEKLLAKALDISRYEESDPLEHVEVEPKLQKASSDE